MSNYRRANTPGGTYFFTLVTHQRKKIFSSEDNITILRDAFRHIKTNKPFDIEAIVILPDHIHCLWKLPAGDADFSGRWRGIKKFVTKRITKRRNQRNEGDVWQRRFWEHQIRSDEDWQRHMDYIHYNPVKHGYVDAPVNWQWSSFNKWVRHGVYAPDWGVFDAPRHIMTMEIE